MLGFTATNAKVITSKVIECECFNMTNSQTECRDNVMQCGNNDSKLPSSCFVVWSTNNLTGL